MIPHLQEREKPLEPLGFTAQEAEWITLVCLHSGIFMRDQVAFYLKKGDRFTGRRFVQTLIETKVSGRSVAAEELKDGRLICRIFGKQIYRALDLSNVRHRRDASTEVTRRRLLSLDFVLDHPDLAWLPTEQDKVSCFYQLGIEPDLLPRRIYDGRANGLIHYSPIKMPLAVEQDRAIFVYIDPGMSTRSEHSWGTAQANKLRGSRGHLGTEISGPAQRVLQSWGAGNTAEAEQEAEALRQAIADADWDTIDHHGGLDAIMDKIDQLKQKTPASSGAALIDDFRVWGSRRCRRKGGTFI